MSWLSSEIKPNLTDFEEFSAHLSGIFQKQLKFFLKSNLSSTFSEETEKKLLELSFQSE